jgi:hypothetical protein
MKEHAGSETWESKSASKVGSWIGRLLVIAGILGLALNNEFGWELGSWLATASFAVMLFGLIVFLLWWFAPQRLKKERCN